MWLDYTERLVAADAIACRGFKGLKQAIKLEYKLSRYDRVWAHSRVAAA